MRKLKGKILNILKLSAALSELVALLHCVAVPEVVPLLLQPRLPEVQVARELVFHQVAVGEIGF